MAYLNDIKIIKTMPCIAIPERIRFIAELDRDISEIMPYLNAVIEGAIYNHEGKNITLKKNDRLLGIQARQIAGAKIIDMKDAQDIINWFKDLVNECYEKRDSITPNYERRQRLTALDIYKLLPGTNCKKCGELTCLAFAVKLASEEKKVVECSELLSNKFQDKKEALFKILKSCGYDVL